MKQTCFSYFWCGFKIKTSTYAWTCDEQPRTCEEHIRIFKNIQTYSRNLNNYYHALILILIMTTQKKKQVREMDFTFMQDSYNGEGDFW